MSHFKFSNVIYSRGEIDALLQKARKGDTTAFTSLYHHYFNPVYRYVFSRVNNKEEADDIVQHAFLAWHTHMPRFTLEHTPLQFLFVVARRKIIDTQKKEDRYTHIGEEDWENISDDDNENKEEQLDETIEIDHLKKLIRTLSEREQDIINLFFFGEQSTIEIAKILSLEESNVRQIKKRALDTIIQKVTTEKRHRA